MSENDMLISELLYYKDARISDFHHQRTQGGGARVPWPTLKPKTRGPNYRLAVPSLRHTHFFLEFTINEILK